MPNTDLYTRYHALVDKSFLSELSDEEKAELQRINEALDKEDEPFYKPVIHKMNVSSIMVDLLKIRCNLLPLISDRLPDLSRLVKAEEYIRLAIEELRD